jgi:thiol-disulfide isomerase/thioredoxin
MAEASTKLSDSKKALRCVAAPLAAALMYIGQSGDVILGGSALCLKSWVIGPETFQHLDSNLAGELTPISKWRGKILIINFWATWCPPCLKEIPDFITLQNEYA